MSSPIVEGVVDLTFMDIREENDVSSQLNLKLHPPAAPTSPSGKTNSTLADSAALSPTKSRKDEIKAIRLGNNNISRLEVLYTIPQQLDGTKLLWLDLSFNDLSTIHPDLASHFPNLTTIYLHANKISQLPQVKNLMSLQHLRALSLFGNPMEEKKHYRNYVLYHCNKLTQFDKSPVTKSQQSKVNSSIPSLRLFLIDFIISQ